MGNTNGAASSTPAEAGRLNAQMMTKQKAKRCIYLSLKGIICVAIIVFLWIRVDFSKVFLALHRADYGYLCLGFLCVIFSRVLLAWQTAKAIQHFDIGLRVSTAFRINLIVNFYSLFLPSGLTGGVIKWYRFSQCVGRPAEVLASIASTKLFNLICMLTMGIVVLVFDNPFSGKVLQYAILALLLITFCAMFMCLADSLPGMAKLYHYFLNLLPDVVAGRMDKLWRSIKHFNKLEPLHIFYFLLVPPSVLFSITVLYYLIGLSLGLSLPIYTMVWIGSMVFLIQHIPASISGLGLREGALVFLLPMYGVVPSQAMAFSLILFGYVLAMGLIGGLFELNEQFLKKDAQGYGPTFHLLRNPNENGLSTDPNVKQGTPAIPPRQAL